ncbi:MAG: hypothetical protein ACI9G1_003576 [Pirellulaceae bacterium]|jgi:hypothetical protein
MKLRKWYDQPEIELENGRVFLSSKTLSLGGASTSPKRATAAEGEVAEIMRRHIRYLWGIKGRLARVGTGARERIELRTRGNTAKTGVSLPFPPNPRDLDRCRAAKKAR